ncbi:MAG: toll-Interleukin receptor [Aquimonas sp.]|nr:toll-Interleukin receptor [Aquimonas sp.]
MALFVEANVRQRGLREVQRSGVFKKAERLVVEAMESYSSEKSYDIFLSHSFRDAELILGIKCILEDLGYSVYVDWIDDLQLDRTKVTPATADKLRRRMGSSKSLFYVTTGNAVSSKWMPWECGYFDGLNEKVAIVPVVESSQDNVFRGQEYLGLYPYVVKQQNKRKEERLWVRLNECKYLAYNAWVLGSSASWVWKDG